VTVCPFAVVRGDDRDLPGTNAFHEPGFARLTTAKSATNNCAHAWHNALRIAVIGPPGDKWRHPGNGHA
jgi:hypothetical protein